MPPADSPNEVIPPELQPPTRITKRTILTALLTGVTLLATFLLWVMQPPTTFTDEQSFQVESGMSVQEIAEAAKADGLVRSSFLLYSSLTLLHDPTKVFAGTYAFPTPLNVFAVADRLASGEIEDTLVRLTIPEGTRARDIGTIIAAALPGITAETYSETASAFEGYLFPETYLVPEFFTTGDIIALQLETYQERTLPLRAQLDNNRLTEDEILILASIIEREANDDASMRMVSGILQNRLAIGMPLQADASIEYVLDTPLNELAPGELAEKLRELDSPYNTYQYQGLPPTPIGNPGLAAITAALEPTPSKYFFYVTGTDGTFYYAETLDKHNDNIARHLR